MICTDKSYGVLTLNHGGFRIIINGLKSKELRLTKIRSNVNSLSNRKHLKETQDDIDQSSRKLSSGERITRASDDVASLSQSDKLKSTLRSKGQAHRNANDAISIVQVASGALTEMSSMILRMRELAVQSASDAYTTGDRHSLGMEFKGLTKEIDRIAKTTEYNGTKLFLGKEQKLEIHIDSGKDMKKNKVSLDLTDLAQTVWALGISDANIDSQLHAQTSLPKLDYALRSISESAAKLGAVQKRFESAASKLNNDKQTLGSANSKLKDADYALESAKMVSAKTQQDAQLMVTKYANFDQNVMLKLFEKSE